MPRKTNDEERNPGLKASTEERQGFAAGFIASYCRVGAAGFGLWSLQALHLLSSPGFCLRKLSCFLWSLSVLEALSPESPGVRKVSDLGRTSPPAGAADCDAPAPAMVVL